MTLITTNNNGRTRDDQQSIVLLVVVWFIGHGSLREEIWGVPLMLSGFVVFEVCAVVTSVTRDRNGICRV
jgi:hypothetical protein